MKDKIENSSNVYLSPKFYFILFYNSSSQSLRPITERGGEDGTCER